MGSKGEETIFNNPTLGRGRKGVTEMKTERENGIQNSREGKS